MEIHDELDGFPALIQLGLRETECATDGLRLGIAIQPRKQCPRSFAR